MDTHAQEPRPDSVGEGHIEAEWQFECGDPAGVRRWLEGPASELRLTIGAPVIFDLHDQYFDTQDWRIFRAGYALRIRSGRDRIEACLKALSGPIDGIARRRELREPLPDADPDHLVDMLGAVGTRISRICGRRNLRGIGGLHTLREERTVRMLDGHEGLIAIDETTIFIEDGTPAEVTHTLEVEVSAGATGLFQPFVRKMQAELSLAPAAMTKFEHALRTRGLDPAAPDDLGPTEVDPGLTTGEVAYAVLRRQFALFLRNEPGTRLGEDPGRLHDMRVASRRLRAALRLFEEALPARPAASMRAQLRVVGQALGAVRDLDIMIGQIESWKPRIVTTNASAVDPLLGILEQRRETARRDLLRILDSPRYERLVASASEILRRAPSGRLPQAAAPIRLTGPALIGRARKTLVRTGRGVRSKASPATYHAVRIRAKRLRYTLEFLVPIYGGPAKRMIRALVRLQDLLGLQQDSEVAIAALREIAAAQGDRFSAATMWAVGEIARMHAERIGRGRKHFRGVYRRLRGSPWKRLKGALVAQAQDFASDLVRDAIRGPASRGGKGKESWNSTSFATQSPLTETPSDGRTTVIDP